MPRYVRQRNDYSCGPVALLNALKWAGRKGAYRKDIELLKAECGTTRKGTPFANMVYAARFHRGYFSVTSKRNVTIADINAHLRRGGAVILGSVSTILDPDAYHYFLITERIGLRGEASYRTVNFDRRATQRLVSSKLIREGMRRAAALDVDRKGRPYALFLRKR